VQTGEMMGRCSGTWWTLPVEVFYAMEVVVGVSAASRVCPAG